MKHHTPGPWKEGGEEHLNQGFDVEAPAGWTLATAYYDSDRGAESVSTAEANVRLIAAAPTMYDFITRKAAEGDGEASRILEGIHGTA